MKTPAASDVERRKKVRIRIRRDLDIAPQKYEGKTYYVVKDPVSLRYYRFKEQERFLIGLMNGRHTLDDAQKQFEQRFRPERLTLEDLESFAQQLLTAGLAQNESPQAGKQLFDRRKKRKRSEWMQTLTNILYIKIPVFDPDKLLERMLPWTRWMFTQWFLVVSILFMLSAIMLVATHFQTFQDKLPSYHEFFSFKTVFYLWFALGAVKIIHEFGHGLSCKAFGGEVHEMGMLFLVFSPCLYCNVSDAWTLPNKWKRIIISAAGIYVELMIAGLATFIWWNTPSNPFVNNLALSLMIVCSVSTVVFNGNPLMRYDGYYVLADWLEIPNLRDRANRYLQRLTMEYCLGIETQPEPYMALWRRILFLAYAIVSYIYRWVVTFSILYFMAMFLKPYKLGVISGMLACAAAASMVGWPLYRLGKNVYKRGRLPDMKPVRTSVSIGALVVLLLAFFLVPLPISRLRETALVQVEDTGIAKVYVTVPGILEKLYVKDGQTVNEGDLLAELRDIELENQLEEARSQRDIYEEQIKGLKRQKQIAEGQDPAQITELLGRINSLQTEKLSAEAQVVALEKTRMALELRAPRSGVVMSPPRIDEIGRRWDREQDKPFCIIGDPAQLRVLVPVTPADYRLLKQDLASFEKEGKPMDVTIRVQGRADLTWSGRVSQVPEAEAKEVPVQLTNKGGGNIAVKPDSRPGVLAPQAQLYLVQVKFLDPDQAICPGTMAKVKVHCKWRSGAWWAWRSFCQLFDLGMDYTDFMPGFLRSR